MNGSTTPSRETDRGVAGGLGGARGREPDDEERGTDQDPVDLDLAIAGQRSCAVLMSDASAYPRRFSAGPLTFSAGACEYRGKAARIA